MPEILFGGSRGGGKALALDTPLPTPFGWTLMGEVIPGDLVFDEKGHPCRVVAATKVMHGRPCYRVRFSDGAEIIADADHQWRTQTQKERISAARASDEWRAARRARRPSRAVAVSKKPGVSLVTTARNRAREYVYAPPNEGSIKTTAQIAATIGYDPRGGYNHSIDVAPALQCEHVALPLDPYVLGLWLGDGTTAAGRMTTADNEIVQSLAANGYTTVQSPGQKYAYGVPGLATPLRTLGVLGNKHIPAAYLRASEAQRLALLQGLMDTDGTADMRGQCEFTVTKRVLAEGVAELLASLGIKAALREGNAKLNGRIVSPKYTLKFITEKPAFRLSRKLIRQKRAGFRGTHERRYIVACEPVESVPVRCIQVDSPNHLYLAGRAMIPTHNSDGILGKWAIKSERYGSGFNAVFFRQEMPQQDDLTERGKEIFGALGAEWVEYKKTFNFPGGGRLRFRPLESVNDANKYQGQNLSDAAVEEAGNYPSPQPIDMLHGALRSVKGVPVQLTLTANPGGAGHTWIKHRYIDPAPLGMKILTRQGHQYIYIPSRVQDNRALLARDPGYISRLHLVGSEALVKAWLTGDWNVVAGAFFDQWDLSKHVIAPFEVPPHWVRFGSFDWGSARPFSMQWWCVSDGSLLPDGRQYPPGAMILYREWYGASAPNEGLRMSTAEVAAGIRYRERGDKIDYRVADPACWKVDGGPSHAEIFANHGLIFRRADNSRVAGWTQMRDRMLGLDGVPMLYAFSTAIDFIRTVPVMQHDTVRPEDIDTSAEDHCFVGDTLVATPFGAKRLDQMPERGLVYGPDGALHAYHGCRVRQRDVPTVRLTFDDGTTVVCTPDHRFMLRDGSWRRADEMLHAASYAVMLPACNQSSYPPPSKSSTALGSTCAADISSAKGDGFMSPCGNTTTALSRPGITSTISTVIERITPWKIWRVSPDATILSSTDLSRENARSSIFLALAQRLSLGTSQKKDGRGTGSTGENARKESGARRLIECATNAVTRSLSACRTVLRRVSVPMPANLLFAGPPAWMMCNVSASNAAGLSPSTATQKPKPAPLSARAPCPAGVGPVCLSVEPAPRADVYCLTVPGPNAFALAGGIVVSNCADSARYAVMSRPWTRQPSVVLPMRSLGQMTMDEAWRLARPKKQSGRI